MLPTNVDHPISPIHQTKSKKLNLNLSLQMHEISVVRKDQIEVLLSADVCLFFIICNLSILAKNEHALELH